MGFAGNAVGILNIVGATFAIYIGLYYATDPQLWARLVRRRIFLPGPWRYGWPEEYLRASRVRRERLGAYLEAPVPVRLLETRAGFQETDALSEAQAVAQLATFQWQVEDPLLLQLALVTDLCLLINREKAGQDPSASPPITAVSLRFLSPSRYPFFPLLPGAGQEWFASPWCVVVQAREPARIVDLLHPELDRIGISLAVERPARAARQTGRCLAAGGWDGQVGGYLQDRRQQRGMTCSHVLADGCQHRSYREEIAEVMGPDVALIREGPCFGAPTERRAVTPLKVTGRDLLHPLRVIMTPHNRVRGELQEITAVAIYHRRLHDFPHVKVWLPRFTLFGIPLPRWPRTFSRPGDSGSWVVTEYGANWIGMVVGDAKDKRAGYVLLAHPLMNYLRWRHAVDKQTDCFIGGEKP